MGGGPLSFLYIHEKRVLRLRGVVVAGGCSELGVGWE